MTPVLLTPPTAVSVTARAIYTAGSHRRLCPPFGSQLEISHCLILTVGQIHHPFQSHAKDIPLPMNYRRTPDNPMFGNTTSYRTEELQVRALLKFEKILT